MTKRLPEETGATIRALSLLLHESHEEETPDARDAWRILALSARQEHDALCSALRAERTQVKRWEDKEVARASDCCRQEERAKKAEAKAERLRGALTDLAERMRLTASDTAVRRAGLAIWQVDEWVRRIAALADKK